jgi:nucleotide-binding universal stress UspA family protein
MAKVLVAVDGSELALDAARQALALLAPDSDVTVLAVARPVILPVTDGSGLASVGAMTPLVLEEATEGAVAAARDDAAAAVAALGIDAHARVEEGEPGTMICQVAKEEGFDVIVVGSHGSGFVKRALLGSVSNHVLHHAPCPVLVVRPERADHG